jgi:hypothetical protein
MFFPPQTLFYLFNQVIEIITPDSSLLTPVSILTLRTEISWLFPVVKLTTPSLPLDFSQEY